MATSINSIGGITSIAFIVREALQSHQRFQLTTQTGIRYEFSELTNTHQMACTDCAAVCANRQRAYYFGSLHFENDKTVIFQALLN